MNDYMTTKQAADELGVDPSHVRRLCEGDILAAAKFGRDWMVDRQAVLNYKANRPKPGPKPKKGQKNGAR